jgi:cell division protein FtsL
MTVGKRQSPAEIGAKQSTRKYLWSSPEPLRARRLPGAIVFLIAVGIIGAVGMLYLLQTNHVANLGYEMSELQAERQAALVEQQELSAQIASRQALTAVETTARTELGMGPIEDYVFVDVELPAEEDASSPQVTPSSQPSAIERFWNRLTGTSSGSQEKASDD